MTLGNLAKWIELVSLCALSCFLLPHKILIFPVYSVLQLGLSSPFPAFSFPPTSQLPCLMPDSLSTLPFFRCHKNGKWLYMLPFQLAQLHFSSYLNTVSWEGKEMEMLTIALGSAHLLGSFGWWMWKLVMTFNKWIADSLWASQEPVKCESNGGKKIPRGSESIFPITQLNSAKVRYYSIFHFLSKFIPWVFPVYFLFYISSNLNVFVIDL